MIAADPWPGTGATHRGERRSEPDVAIVIPTVGRSSLAVLLAALERSAGPRPRQVVLVDDRPASPEPLEIGVTGWLAELLTVRHSAGGGPAAARNVGWRACSTEWIAFLDDDVIVSESWLADLAAELADAAPDVVGVQGNIVVPLPEQRRPTDWERGTAGLATACWITADLAYRRATLDDVGGFDERFPRAFREDADLALRVQARGGRLIRGTRRTTHPVRPARWHASLDQQRGNADDALMTRLHGRDWYARAGAPRGRRRRHLASCAAGLLAVLGGARRRRGLALLGALGWLAGTAEFALARILPGPRDRAEVARMLATSVLIPPAASWHWLRGTVRHRHARAWPPIMAVLFDRDGTLIHDVPYNGRPELVRPIDGAAAALHRLRRAGVRSGVITNQSGIARGLIDLAEVEQVNARVDALLGPFDTWQVCPHGERDGCDCRKPRPGLVHAAAAALRVPVERCVVVGDTAADVAAGAAAGARAYLVPNSATRPEELGAAPRLAPDLRAVVDEILGTGSPRSRAWRRYTSWRGVSPRTVATHVAPGRRAVGQ